MAKRLQLVTRHGHQAAYKVADDFSLPVLDQDIRIVSEDGLYSAVYAADTVILIELSPEPTP